MKLIKCSSTLSANFNILNSSSPVGLILAALKSFRNELFCLKKCICYSNQARGTFSGINYYNSRKKFSLKSCISSRSLPTTSPLNYVKFDSCHHGLSIFSNEQSAFKSTNVLYRKYSTECDENKPEKKPSLYQRFKQMYKDYWYVLIPVHVITSIGWGGSFYYIACSGVDIAGFLESVGASQVIVDTMRNSPTGYVAVAYTLYKIATPVRYSVTLGGTTMAIKYLSQHGLIKPVDHNKIKKMYSDTKDQIIEKKDNIKENIMEKKSQVLSQMADRNKRTSPTSNTTNQSDKKRD